jgi:hypothetical protein
MVFWGISRGLGDCVTVNEIDRSGVGIEYYE